MAATTAQSFTHSVRTYFRDLKRGRPGHRFQARYERAKRERTKGGSPWRRVVTLTVGVVCLAIGLVLSVIPGPAIPFFFLAGGLFGTESRLIARLMDWIEVRARKLAAWAKRRWRPLPRAAKMALVIFGACCSAGMAYLSYRLMA